MRLPPPIQVLGVEFVRAAKAKLKRLDALWDDDPVNVVCHQTERSDTRA
jgi:hypothetical protein